MYRNILFEETMDITVNLLRRKKPIFKVTKTAETLLLFQIM